MTNLKNESANLILTFFSIHKPIEEIIYAFIVLEFLNYVIYFILRLTQLEICLKYYV